MAHDSLSMNIAGILRHLDRVTLAKTSTWSKYGKLAAVPPRAMARQVLVQLTVDTDVFGSRGYWRHGSAPDHMHKLQSQPPSKRSIGEELLLLRLTLADLKRISVAQHRVVALDVLNVRTELKLDVRGSKYSPIRVFKTDPSFHNQRSNIKFLGPTVLSEERAAQEVQDREKWFQVEEHCVWCIVGVMGKVNETGAEVKVVRSAIQKTKEATIV
ncbi:hypothetical protein BCR44DRAFT_55434 [Catenaria anguillulae PL171]|uniref:Uncharacterized protein n=1 Tax=Catenaria anguillulae PL171 TaxID=765915 RepID=A0A1Y2HP72_9FUNG|nr:hypothetical protein BCR44DRAFT_55434 [Catenaria anguillulae PL171]